MSISDEITRNGDVMLPRLPDPVYLTSQLTGNGAMVIKQLFLYEQ